MRRVCIAIVVGFGFGPGAVAVEAQPARSPAATLAATTDAARAGLATELRDRAAQVAAKARLAGRHASELAEADRVKKQKASWRKQAQLDKAKGVALETAKRLTAIDAAIRVIDTRLAAARARLVVAIDAELGALPDGPRRRELVAARQASAPAAAAVTARKIIVPDAEIDLLADPEELELQAQDLRATEAELAAQLDVLDHQTRRLIKAEQLRKAHDRAGDLAVRDDDQIRRGAGAGGRALAGDEQAGAPDPADGPVPPQGLQGEETTAQILADIIDPATSDALRRAGRASDPGTRANAARRARDQVAARLEALRKKRAAIEARARLLRDR